MLNTVASPLATMVGRGVDPVFSSTTPIRYNEGKDGGTGFFFNYQERTYIVTNRHVVKPDDDSDDDDDINPTEGYIWLRNKTNVSEANRFPIRFEKDGKPTWKTHPAEDVDLAIIPVNSRLSSFDELFDEESTVRSGNLAFTSDYFLHENVRPDQRVSLVGYPGDFMDSETRFPIRRNALIASPHGIGFENKPYFLTDARMHPGTSGSPVVMESRGLQQTYGNVPEERRKDLYLLGVHSAKFYATKFEERNESDQEIIAGRGELDLNVAWYPSLITDIFEDL